MGMSASQARLLSLTSRLSDLELKAQNIDNSKIRLSQAEAVASENYEKALNKQKVTILDADTSGTYVDANAYNLTTYGAISEFETQRFLQDSAGEILVNQSTADAYQNALTTPVNVDGKNVTALELQKAGSLEDYLKTKGLSSDSSTGLSEKVTTEWTTDATHAGIITTKSVADATTTSPLFTYNDSTIIASLGLTKKDSILFNSKIPMNNSNGDYYQVVPLDGSEDGINASLYWNGVEIDDDHNKYLGYSNQSTLITTTANNGDTLLFTAGDYEGLISGMVNVLGKALKNTVSDQFSGNALSSTYNTYLSKAIDDATAATNAKYSRSNIQSVSPQSDYAKVAGTNQVQYEQWAKFNQGTGGVQTCDSFVIDATQLADTFMTYFDIAFAKYLAEGKQSTTTPATYDTNFQSATAIGNAQVGSTSTTRDASGKGGVNVTEKVPGHTEYGYTVTTKTTSTTVVKTDSAKVKYYTDVYTGAEAFMESQGYTGNSTTSTTAGSNISKKYSATAETWYQKQFEEMKTNGYKTVSNTNFKSKEWLYEQLSTGNINLAEYNSDGKLAQVSWNSGDNAIQADSDTDDATKAEASYNSTMDQLEAKDKEFDLQLSRINTEHTAVQTEIDTVKKVIDKNVDRTFKNFDA